MGGFTENAESFRDGWFRTGDLARWLPEGTVELCGRRKYLIKRGGKSVSPVEVGDRVEACPGVRACAVVGVSQPLYGQMIWAFVVPDREHPAQLKDIMKVCRATLPNYMVPDRVSFIDDLPRGSGVGKIDREALIRMASRELETEQGVTRA
jgi:long-chain acyl-CoA synthetase